MSKTDLIADSLAMIRNAIGVRRDEVLVPYSKVMFGITQILKDEGYIDNFKVMELGKIKTIKVYLRYKGKKSAITKISKVSRSGRRIYVGRDKVPNVLSGYGVAVVSTSKGVLSNKEARKLIIEINKDHPLPTKKEIQKQRLRIKAEGAEDKINKKYYCPNSPIEEILNDKLNDTDFKYTRQKNIGKYFVDFYFGDRKLVVECDGHDWHHTYRQMENDFKRQNYLMLNKNVLKNV